MNSHIPFNQGGKCDTSSNDQVVNHMIGNAYYVVKTVYENLGNINLIYDFLTTYGMVLAVESEVELKAMPTTAKFIRIYDKTTAGDRQVTDYLYVEGDRTGVIPDDTTATGSWVKVATSGSSGGGTGGGDITSGGAYVPWVYRSGSAIGGETTVVVPDGTVGVPFIIIEGYMQTVGYGFTYEPTTHTLTLAQALEAGDSLTVLRTGVPANPDDPNISNWVTINWLYNQGTAMGGEQVINIPYSFQDAPAIFKNGLRLYKGLATESYTIDAPNQRIILTEVLATNDRLIVQLGGEYSVLEVQDRTLFEVARSANVTDNAVILSTNKTTPLNGKTILYDVGSQKVWGIPTLPTNVYIVSVTNGVLTYNPGGVQVNLLDNMGTAQVLKVLAATTGAGLVGTSDGSNVQASLSALALAIASAVGDIADVAEKAKRAIGETFWHDMRSKMLDGCVAADGQEVDQVGPFADLYADVAAGNRPTCTEAEWQADPTKRNCYVLNSSAGKMRLPDRNGVQPGSIPAPPLIGDGGGKVAGAVYKGAIPNLTGRLTANLNWGVVTNLGTATGVFEIDTATTTTDLAGNGAANGGGRALLFKANKASDVYQDSVTAVQSAGNVGCFVIRYAGRAQNAGSLDAMTLSARMESINTDLLAKSVATNARIGYALLSVTNPALGSRTVLANPFGNNTPVQCMCEIFHATLSKWVTTPWSIYAVGSISGITSSYAEGEGIVVQTGPNSYVDTSTGASQAIPGRYTTPSPVRIHVWLSKS